MSHCLISWYNYCSFVVAVTGSVVQDHSLAMNTLFLFWKSANYHPRSGQKIMCTQWGRGSGNAHAH